MRNCLECKWMRARNDKRQAWPVSMTCDKHKWIAMSRSAVRGTVLARAIKTAETCSDFEGVSDGQ